MGTLTNREDTDEMPQNVAFHLGLHCLQRQNQSSEKEMQSFLEKIITYDPTINTMGYSDSIVCSFVTTPLVLNGLNSIRQPHLD